jgi:RES domain
VTFDTAEDWGFAAEALVDDDRTACQEFGDVVRSTYDALVVPSAALPGTRNLVLFGARLAAPHGARPVDPDLDVPVAVTAEGSQPPTVLLALVRHLGDLHPGLQAWQAGCVFPPPNPGDPLGP